MVPWLLLGRVVTQGGVLKINGVLQPYKSIKALKLDDIPKFMVITGVNGAGKSQFLEMLRDQFLPARSKGKKEHFELEDCSFTDEEVKYIRSDFPLNSGNYQQLQSLQGPLEQTWLYIIKGGKNHTEEDKLRAHKATFPGFLRSNALPEILSNLEKTTGKPPHDLSYNEFITAIDYDFVLQGKQDITNEITQLFLSYHFRFLDLKSKDTPEDQIQSQLSKAPWAILNEILESTTLGYKCSDPSSISFLGKYRAELIAADGTVVQIADLSSGEKTLLTSLLWLYASENFSVFHKLLLLDEPDAHLHPQLTKDFLRVINDILVEKYETRVIMTTHSPSTVALTPNKSLYYMQKVTSENRIVKQPKSECIKNLLQGVHSITIIPEHKKQIFTESQFDALVYEKLYSYFLENLKKEIFLSFISSGIKGSGSCEHVIETTQSLRNAGNTFTFGIVDWDLKNKSESGVFVPGNGKRYSIENFVYDPLYVYIYAVLENKVDDFITADIPVYDLHRIPDLKVEILQEVSLKTEKLIFGNELKEDQLLDSVRISGFNIQISENLQKIQGHEYEELLKNRFPALFKKYHNNGEMLVRVTEKAIQPFFQFFTKEYLDLMIQIQDS